ncbi:uncharacterized protein LOC115754779 [Rhodamnia argentea]|uniref:Uncharacterized protein LOC115754779 n=1 Tax=Rhodamnia argentea TaxID=178133 RepID=A0A8B8QU13_9MYRT|nr:uncharacterized protein LOC115754779 [Rhodamnia argentea]
MQVLLEKPSQRPRLPQRSVSFAGDTRGSRRCSPPAACPQRRPACTCSRNPGSVQCGRHGYVVPDEKAVKRNQASKEVLRRALAPPARRFSLRRWSFRPTPSRLSTMSTA